MSNKDTFLHKPQGETICFTDNGDGTVTIRWQQTTDPNEELNEETLTKEGARAYWRQQVGLGYKVANDWHTCKRDPSDCGRFDDE